MGGGRFVCFDRGREGTKVLSKQVSVVSIRTRVPSSMSAFEHLRYKHITSLSPIAPPPVSHDMRFNVTLNQ